MGGLSGISNQEGLNRLGVGFKSLAFGNLEYCEKGILYFKTFRPKSLLVGKKGIWGSRIGPETKSIGGGIK